MKIGILTHYTVNNQGAQLQLAAMCEFLQQLGHTPVVLTYEKNFDFDRGEQKKELWIILRAALLCKELSP